MEIFNEINVVFYLKKIFYDKLELDPKKIEFYKPLNF